MDDERIRPIIEKALSENADGLDLAHTGLTEIPPEVCQITTLQELSLADNELIEVIPEIAQLTRLRLLSLRGNNLTAFPSGITQLDKLEILYLSSNGLTKIPPEIGRLQNLQQLYLNDNALEEIPPEIGRLTHLRRLSIKGNNLSSIPPEIGALRDLESLYLDNNRLVRLPPQLGKLSFLERLSVRKNSLTSLPFEIGQLNNLHTLDCSSNILSEFPPEVLAQGTQAILAYLREQLKGSSRQWISKLLVIGEGGTGKTSLLRALVGEPFSSELPTTHGLDVKVLEITHPHDSDVVMQLNAWDFGGQEIYHATHQFFLTSRSLFLLVWNARLGYEQGKLYYWLDTIKARAPGSPVILVATWIDERDAALPYADFRRRYPQIVGFCAVSNKTGEGIAGLFEALARTAAQLPLMGERWPTTWLDAANAVRSRLEKYTTPEQLHREITSKGVSAGDCRVLVNWLHELGDILCFSEDIELGDIVILKPQWVTHYISAVLESKEVISQCGIFTRTHMDQLWSDIPAYMREHFLRLMEKFDISYRTLENREISLVIERLPFDPPDYEEEWTAIRESPGCHEISMKFYLNSIPPGIPTWFIARSHRFTTHTHWRMGAIFRYTQAPEHFALLQTFPHERYLQLTVRGPRPQNFFALLRDGLELTFRRYPGLEIRRAIPCPGHDQTACDYEFDYTFLEKALGKEPPVLEVQCQSSFAMVSVANLLFGIHWLTQNAILSRLDELDKEQLERHNELITLLQREFAKNFRWEQSRLESRCPNVFALRPLASSHFQKALRGEKLELQLYCQAPGCWHPLAEGGRYVINNPSKWLRQMGKYIAGMVSVLKYVSPFLGPVIGMSAPAYAELVKNDIKFMEALVKILPEMTKDKDAMKLADSIEEDVIPEYGHGASLRALRLLLDEVDPQQKWGGLRAVATPEGHILWLCEHHAQEYD